MNTDDVVLTSLRKAIVAAWPRELMGEPIEIRFTSISKSRTLNAAGLSILEADSINAFLGTCAAAISTVHYRGSAERLGLKSSKKRLDISAGEVFNEIWNAAYSGGIAVSEGKDELGEAVFDPIRRKSKGRGGRQLSVDVIDGTTLTSRGLAGAYSLAALASALPKFPDLQAYAIGTHVDAFQSIDFETRPEDALERNVGAIANAYGCSVRALRIVTHSYDTGRHHQELIDRLKSMGCSVIVPDPVIVEPPYVIGGAIRLGNYPHALIGVCGLPEIVIATILARAISDSYEIKFRIASNDPLKHPNEGSLDRAFNFGEAERHVISNLRLSTNKVYDAAAICGNTSRLDAFAAAITDDPVGGLRGVVSNPSEHCVEVEALVGSSTMGLVRVHIKSDAVILPDYTARYSQPLHDISLVCDVSNPDLDDYVQVLRLRRSLDGAVRWQPLVFQDGRELGLHVTIFEFAVHYGMERSKQDADADFFTALKCLQEVDLEELMKIEFLADPAEIHGSSIVIPVHAKPQRLMERVLTPLASRRMDSELWFPWRQPKQLHVTIGRFTRVLTRAEFETAKGQIDGIDLSRLKRAQFKPSTLRLIAAARTPLQSLTIVRSLL